MKHRNATYHLCVVVLTALLGIGEMSAQERADTLLVDSITAVDTVETSMHSPAEALEAPLDTLVADSILANQSKTDQRHHNFKPDPIRAMWLALVIPGAGQIYNRKFWKLPIIYGGFLGCAYALTWNGQMLRDYSQAYLDIMDDDPNTKSYENMLPMGYDMTGKEDRFKTIFKNKKDHYRKYRDMSIFAFAGVYLISVIDAFVDAELSTFDISPDLSLHFEPAIIDTGVPTMRHRHQKSYGLSCNINF